MCPKQHLSPQERAIGNIWQQPTHGTTVWAYHSLPCLQKWGQNTATCFFLSLLNSNGLFKPNFPNQALITTPLVTTVDVFIAYHLLFKKTSKQKKKKTLQGVHPEKINSCNSHRANSTVKTFLFSSGMWNCLTPSTHWAPQPGKYLAGLSIC